MNKIMILLAIMMITGCVNRVIQLEGVEVTEYEGERLDSVNDFRENSIKGVQNVSINEYKLEVTGLVSEERNYTYNEVLGLQAYSKVVTLYCVEGWDAKILWQGVLIKELLEGIKGEANTIILHAVDGYTTSFPKDYIMNNDIILAYKMNNATLPAERGYPFTLVAQDKWGYKWIKWVNKIEASNDSSYEGYWESRGYNNEGSLKGSIFK